MNLDFQALLDPAKIREAGRERERQETEQAERDARMAASLAALGHASDALRLTNAEGRFVRQVTAIWKRTGYLTAAQTEWVKDLAARHCFVLQSPAGTYVVQDGTAFVVRSARDLGEMNQAPDIEALIELGRAGRWLERDIAALQTRWGRRPQSMIGGSSRFSFGARQQPLERLPASRGEAKPASEEDTSEYTPFFQGTSVFSNWYKAAFVVDGTMFNCVEQYMMYRKAKLFGDEGAAVAVLSSSDPARQKALGRKVSGFDDATWIENRESIVRTGVLAKFSQNPSIRDALLATAGTELVEASPYDRVWGVGLGATDPRIKDRRLWRGENLLGKILTDVREALMREAQRTDSDSIDQKAAQAERDQVHSGAARFIFGPVPEPALAGESLRQDYQRQ
ncbi:MULTISPECIES: NADAR family protein [unclassified Cupriavidus]|uniref:NADAR family protein n=1 Tax=unclassified Cupriavidus TaxID=2640874 RepID=UPI00313D58DB